MHRGEVTLITVPEVNDPKNPASLSNTMLCTLVVKEEDEEEEEGDPKSCHNKTQNWPKLHRFRRTKRHI